MGKSSTPRRPLAAVSRTLVRGTGVVCWATVVSWLVACASEETATTNASTPTESTEPEEPGVPDPVDAPPELDCGGVQPVESQGRLLTRAQYENVIRDLFGGQVQGPFTQDFPVETLAAGFGTNAEIHRATPLLADTQWSAAERISAQAVEALDVLLDCSQWGRDVGCVEAFIDRYATRAFRRPLTVGERDALLGVFTRNHQELGFDSAFRLVIESMLQAPQFLYRFEHSGIDSGLTALQGADNDGVQQKDRQYVALNGYELASRLSFLLWNSIPDDELLAAALDDALSTPEQLEAQARRMMSDARSQAVLSDFHHQWLHLDPLTSAVRELDPLTVYPDGQQAPSAAFGAAWTESIDHFLAHIYQSATPTLESLFLTPAHFLDRDLSQLYGVPFPEAQAGAGQFAQVELDPGLRVGLLTQPGLMALLSHPDQSAPVQRGVFVRERLLCQPPPPPPPSVDSNPPDPAPDLTTRERFAEHSADPECSFCHQLLDPVGLSFEHFDQAGRYRESENGTPVDAHGELIGTHDANLQTKFDGAVELSELLAHSPQVSDCLTSQWYRYGMGRVEQEEDLCSLNDIRHKFAASGNDLREVLIAMATTEAFRYRKLTPDAAKGVTP